MTKIKSNTTRIGTWNIRTLNKEVKKIQLADDITKFDCEIVGVQETHYKGTGVEILKASTGETYTLYYTGDDTSSGGVGIIIKETTKAEFKRINDRICQANIMLKENRKLVVINAYAPTNPVSEKNPEKREEFYEALESAIKAVSKRSILMITGDFNAKTGSAHKKYPNHVGKYGKGQVNENGETLLETAQRNNLVLTNTTFQHKLSHRTTWESPYRKYTMKNGEERRNPNRNQIDYIIVKAEYIKQITNSRSYHHGTTIETDHRLVIADTKLSLIVHKPSKQTRKPNLEKLREKDTQEQYKTEVDKILENTESASNIQERWNEIVKANNQAAETILGYKKKKQKSTNPIVIQLSEQQRRLNTLLDTTTDPQK
jgi:exonuclease III